MLRKFGCKPLAGNTPTIDPGTYLELETRDEELEVDVVVGKYVDDDEEVVVLVLLPAQ